MEIVNIGMILDYKASGEETALLAEFKISLNAYLKELVSSPVRTMADVIAFNNKNPELVSLQALFLSLIYIHVKSSPLIMTTLVGWLCRK